MLEHMLKEAAEKYQMTQGSSISVPREIQADFRKALRQIISGDLNKTVLRLKYLLVQEKEVKPVNQSYAVLEKYLVQLSSLQHVISEFK